ncbi:hypothetical protein [Erythrobacter sp.]|uniref:hypothetical protein n=1 Tax=Erythrobacter sp. TaxID=1042 RepID=UPI00311F8278
MEQQTLSQTTGPQDTKKDRTIAVTCTPTLIWNSDGSIGASATFTQTGQTPDHSNMKNRVASDGDLKLSGLKAKDGYNDNVDITFTLDTSQMVDKNGNSVAGRWATATEYSGTGPVTGYLWFCQVQNVSKREYNTTPITITGMSAVRGGDTQVTIDDDTDDTAPDYAYCLGLVLPDNGDYYITLDPMLGSKGTSGVNEFMLRK